MTPITFRRSDGSTFTLTPTMPQAFAARFDLTSVLASNDAAKKGRALTAALGLGLAGQRPASGPGERVAMPVYRNNGEITLYGGTVMEVLAAEWQTVPDIEFWRACNTLALEIIGSLPSQEGIDAATNFT